MSSFFINPYIFGGASAFTHIASANYTGSNTTNGSTTSSIDTTGAKLIVLCVANYTVASQPTVSDSKSNTWTALTYRNASTSGMRIYYCISPTVGSGHTFTTSGSGSYSNIFAMAFSSTGTPTFASQNGAANTSATSGQGGTVTPPVDNCLVVSGLCAHTALNTSMAVNESFSITATMAQGGSSIASAAAYQIQTSATARNPTWSWTNSTNHAIANAVFTPS